LADAVAARQPVAVATVVAGAPDLGVCVVITPEASHGSLGSDRLDQAVTDDVRGMLGHGRTGLLHLGSDGERRAEDLSVFVQSYAPPPTMIVFGAIDFAAAMARVGKFLGYHVTVCDARPSFATRKRFPDVDELVVAWPHKYLGQVEIDERTALCVLTHDLKFDVPLLTLALRTKAGYIGAMGSRRTHQDRLQRLREVGMSEQELARLCSPIGLDLGARTPEETAVSIAAEIIARTWGGTGQPLTSMAAPIHRESLASDPVP
jgi:xanthine dehydrogenase accessory factor